MPIYIFKNNAMMKQKVISSVCGFDDISSLLCQKKSVKAKMNQSTTIYSIKFLKICSVEYSWNFSGCDVFTGCGSEGLIRGCTPLIIKYMAKNILI